MGGGLPLPEMGKQESADFKGGDLKIFGDKFHFGEAESERLSDAQGDDQEDTGHVRSSSSKFKVRLDDFLRTLPWPPV